MFCGAYWSQRSESREQAAARVAALLKALEGQHGAFATWSLKKARKDDPARVLVVAHAEIAKHFETNRKDVGGDVMPDLGFRLALWNEAGASLSVTIGARNERVRNAVALSYGGTEEISPAVWRGVLRALVDSMAPEHAGVATEKSLSQNPQAFAWQVGWATYERGQGIVERSSPQE
jgi:hypothetical protein